MKVETAKDWREYVMLYLQEVGLDPTYTESANITYFLRGNQIYVKCFKGQSFQEMLIPRNGVKDNT